MEDTNMAIRNRLNYMTRNPSSIKYGQDYLMSKHYHDSFGLRKFCNKDHTTTEFDPEVNGDTYDTVLIDFDVRDAEYFWISFSNTNGSSKIEDIHISLDGDTFIKDCLYDTFGAKCVYLPELLKFDAKMIAHTLRFKINHIGGGVGEIKAVMGYRA